MSIDINVYLRNKGGRTTRAKSKLSTKETHTNKKGKNSAIAGIAAKGKGFGASGFTKALVIVTAISLVAKKADKVVQFGTAIYQARSGESMISSNIRAYSKLLATGGMSYAHGVIDNWLYREPEVQRQNYMLDYGRELYNQNIENKKNRFS